MRSSTRAPGDEHAAIGEVLAEEIEMGPNGPKASLNMRGFRSTPPAAAGLTRLLVRRCAADRPRAARQTFARPARPPRAARTGRFASGFPLDQPAGSPATVSGTLITAPTPARAALERISEGYRRSARATERFWFARKMAPARRRCRRRSAEVGVALEVAGRSAIALGAAFPASAAALDQRAVASGQCRRGARLFEQHGAALSGEAVISPRPSRSLRRARARDWVRLRAARGRR